MKKTLAILTTFLMLSVGALVGQASALTLDYYTGDAAHAVYQDTGDQYFQLTDPGDPASTPTLEVLSTLIADFGQDYQIGIFDYVDPNEMLPIIDSLLGISSDNVIFDVAGGTATTTTGGNTANIGTVFGYYIEFEFDGIYKSDDLNDHFRAYYDYAGLPNLPSSTIQTYPEMAIGVGGPETRGHALLAVQDISPVPEPATMLLFGTGLAGLAGITRRRKK